MSLYTFGAVFPGLFDKSVMIPVPEIWTTTALLLLLCLAPLMRETAPVMWSAEARSAVRLETLVITG